MCMVVVIKVTIFMKTPRITIQFGHTLAINWYTEGQRVRKQSIIIKYIFFNRDWTYQKSVAVHTKSRYPFVFLLAIKFYQS